MEDSNKSSKNTSDTEKQDKNKDIEIAKISAFQATIVALIGAFTDVFTTLIGTGILSPKPAPQIESIQHSDPSTSPDNSANYPGYYGISTLSIDISNNLEECKQRARTSLTRSGFTGVRSTETSTWGVFHGYYSTSIRCFSNKELAVVAISGPNDDIRSQVMERIFNNF